MSSQYHRVPVISPAALFAAGEISMALRAADGVVAGMLPAVPAAAGALCVPAGGMTSLRLGMIGPPLMLTRRSSG
jgi:hypothetical protein